MNKDFTRTELRFERNKRGLSQGRLGLLTGLGRCKISMFENGDLGLTNGERAIIAAEMSDIKCQTCGQAIN